MTELRKLGRDFFNEFINAYGDRTGPFGERKLTLHKDDDCDYFTFESQSCEDSFYFYDDKIVIDFKDYDTGDYNESASFNSFNEFINFLDSNYYWDLIDFSKFSH